MVITSPVTITDVFSSQFITDDLRGNVTRKVAVIGSRKFPDMYPVYQFVERLPPGTVVVSGHADGVDQAAEQAANHCKLDVLLFPVDTVGLPLW